MQATMACKYLLKRKQFDERVNIREIVFEDERLQFEYILYYFSYSLNTFIVFPFVIHVI